MADVALLGMGAMGSRIAARLLAAGRTVVVWNRSPPACEALAAKGAQVARTPAAAAARASSVIAMVSDREASSAVWEAPDHGALWGLRRGALAVEMGTVPADHCRALAGRVAQRGARFVDAPVVGSRPQADAGALVVLAGGAEPDVVALQALLDPCAAAVHRAGDVGAGATLKLLVNALFGLQVAALGEWLGLLRRSPLPLADSVAVLQQLPVLSPAAAGAAAAIAAGDHAPRFPLPLVAKDFRYALSLCEQLGAEVPLTRCAAGLYAQSAQARPDDNITAIAERFR